MVVQGQNNLYQQIDDGSTPIPSLHFSSCSLKDVSSFIKRWHYSHTHPGGIDFAFRLDMDGQLAGACVFGYMAGNPIASCVFEDHNNPHEYRELMRLVLLNEVPRNSESRFIGWCIRQLKKTTLIGLISFADPKYGHSGTIYRASNWIYTGLQKPDRDRIYLNGIERHPKSLYNLYGTSSIEKLRSMLPSIMITTSPREPKHRFIYPLKIGLVPKKRLFNGPLV